MWKIRGKSRSSASKHSVYKTSRKCFRPVKNSAGFQPRWAEHHRHGAHGELSGSAYGKIKMNRRRQNEQLMITLDECRSRTLPMSNTTADDSSHGIVTGTNRDEHNKTYTHRGPWRASRTGWWRGRSRCSRCGGCALWPRRAAWKWRSRCWMTTSSSCTWWWCATWPTRSRRRSSSSSDHKRLFWNPRCQAMVRTLFMTRMVVFC